METIEIIEFIIDCIVYFSFGCLLAERIAMRREK